MDKLTRSKIDHMRLVPGIYVSGTFSLGSETVTIFDIRVKRPNFEDAMSPEVSHTIERIGYAFLKEHPALKDSFIHFCPIGCLTGFHLILKGEYSNFMRPVVDVILSMMKFIVGYTGNLESMGFDAESCGNCKLHDLDGAKDVCANFLVLDETFDALHFEYPTAENSPSICTSTHIFGDDEVNIELKIAKKLRQPVEIDYPASERSSESYHEPAAPVTEEAEIPSADKIRSEIKRTAQQINKKTKKKKQVKPELKHSTLF